MSNTNIRYRLNLNGIIDNLSTQGIRFIKPTPINPETLAGLQWDFFFEVPPRALNPTDALIFENSNRTTSVRFTSYKESSFQEDSEDELGDLVSNARMFSTLELINPAHLIPEEEDGVDWTDQSPGITLISSKDAEGVSMEILEELVEADRKAGVFPQHWIASQEDDGSISIHPPNESTARMNTGDNSSSTATSRPYPEAAMQPYEYAGGHPPRQLVQAYTQENPNLRTLGRRKPPEQSYFRSGHVVLNVTEIDPQLLDNYIEQWIVTVIRDYDRHKDYVTDGW
ncbi:hypothetical protein SLA2020_369760 [Shorea laevis]